MFLLFFTPNILWFESHFGRPPVVGFFQFGNPICEPDCLNKS